MVASDAVHWRREGGNTRGLRPVRRYLKHITFTLTILRFGNRYFENLNAEQEVPGTLYSAYQRCPCAFH